LPPLTPFNHGNRNKTCEVVASTAVRKDLYPAAATHVFTDRGHVREAGTEPKGEKVTLWVVVGSTAWERVRLEPEDRP
jgi:hypothetical protein